MLGGVCWDVGPLVLTMPVMHPVLDPGHRLVPSQSLVSQYLLGLFFWH